MYQSANRAAADRRGEDGMSIREPGTAPVAEQGTEQTDADEDYARQLQAQMDAQEYRKA